ncbi:hypothetical protein [Kitasatospora sp. LaBMicrA B282]|uniref:hypothetical protein n=1 Tax=Kitasatospora sp. LaBMicrA B282 TaxID=3420949 RepID=UPI003D13EE3B
MSTTVPTRAAERQDELTALERELATLDRSLILIVRRRTELVAAIEALRRAHGLPGTELTKENELLQLYRHGLGREGVQLALQLLEIGRAPS